MVFEALLYQENQFKLLLYVEIITRNNSDEVLDGDILKELVRAFTQVSKVGHDNLRYCKVCKLGNFKLNWHLQEEFHILQREKSVDNMRLEIFQELETP